MDKLSNGRYVELKREFEFKLQRTLTRKEINFIEWLVIQEAREKRDLPQSTSFTKC